MAKRKSKEPKIPVKLLVSLAFFAAGILGAWGLARVFLTGHPYFNINKVSVEGAEGERYLELRQRLIGKNIFSQDLYALKKQIEQWPSDTECVAIRRRLPAELLFTLKKRVAIAQLKLGRFYPVDYAGVIMGRPSDISIGVLPVILGMEEKSQKAKGARSYSLRDARLAIELIRQKADTAALSDYKITKIDVRGQKASSFFIVRNFTAQGMKMNAVSNPEAEVRFDLDKPQETIKMLALVIARRRNLPSALQEGVSPLAGIEYIDLRDVSSPVVLEKKNK